MIYRIFPGTELNVSVVGMGCWAIGGKWWGDDVNDDNSIACVRAAVESGVNFFDTAPLYGHGHADEILVRALGSKRHDVVIATKVGIRFQGTTGHAQSDLSKKHIREDTEVSLKRLKLDSIPLMQIHWPCELGTPLEESMEALLELQMEGKIQHIGVCNYNAEGMKTLLKCGRVDSLQTPLSMVRKRYGQDLKDVCNSGLDTGSPIGVIGYEPLCRGLLTGKYTKMPLFPPGDVRAQDDWFKGTRYLQVNELVRLLRQIAGKVRSSPAALAIAWSAAQEGVTTTIVGAKRPEQIRQNAAASMLLEKKKLMKVVEQVVADQPPI